MQDILAEWRKARAVHHLQKALKKLRAVNDDESVAAAMLIGEAAAVLGEPERGFA